MIEQGAYSFISHGFGFGYFNTAYLQIFQMGHNGSLYVDLNDNPYDSSQSPSNCAIYNCLFDFSTGQWQMYVYAEVIETIFDYSIFNTQTVVLANEMDKVEAGTSTIDNLLNVIEGVVGTVSCNGIEPSQVDVFNSVHNFSYFKTNTCTFAVLARYLNSFSIRDIINEGNKRVQFRARKIRQEWWKPFYHAVISNSAKDRWLSGFPDEINQTILFGYSNHLLDRPDFTLIAGFITAIQDPETVFDQLFQAVTFYDDGLSYQPNPLPLTSSYNSNSFAQGLVNLVGTISPITPLGAPGMSDTVDISINSLRFPGLYKPVPKSEFGF